MSKRDVDSYYKEVCEQYNQMIEEIHDFEKECEQGLIEPERLDKIKENIQPLKNNYMTLSYIMYLLNQPVRKSKKKAYERRSDALLKFIDNNCTKDGVLKQNKKVLDTFNSK